MRRVEHEQSSPPALPASSRAGPPNRSAKRATASAFFKRRQHRRIARDQGAHLDILGGQRRRQRAGHIGEAAGLDQRDRFRTRPRERASGFIEHSLSIIGWVIRQMPLSVRRKRSASSSGSSPTTRPGGMRTPCPRSHCCSRAPRPISTSGRITAFSTWRIGIDAHAGEQQRARRSAPETMQPPETSEEIAWPRRPSSSCTNLAGGVDLGIGPDRPVAVEQVELRHRPRSGRYWPPNRRRACRHRANRA